MSRRVSRGIVALAVLPLGGSALAVLSPVMSGSATAACAPSLAVTQHAKAPKKAKVHAAKPVVSKIHKKKYVAKVAITAKQGTATVVAAQSVCPDGAAGAAASTTQSASGKGTVTKSVSAKGHSKKAAKKAVKAKAKKAVAKLKKKGATKKGRKKAKKRAVAAARPLAVRKAHDALYLSDVVYLVANSSSDYHLTANRPAGTPALSTDPGGDITVSVPAGFDADAAPIALPCLRRAPAWPTSFAFDGGVIASPQLQSFARSQHRTAALQGLVVGASSAPTPLSSGSQWEGGWIPTSTVSGGTSVTTYDYSAGIDEPVKLIAGGFVCFTADTNPDEPAYTATLRGARVGGATAGSSAPDSSHVIGGVPVGIR